MGTVSNARLFIRQDRPTRTAAVRVTCNVQFSPDEVSIMRRQPKRMYFSMYCRLYGRDVLATLDDELYSFESKILPQGPPAPREEVAFEATLAYDKLNEDFVGADEIFARLVLRGWVDFKGSVQEVETEPVKMAFA